MLTKGIYYSWEIVSETIAIKEVDKSVKLHNASGVPIEVRGFFDVENLEIKENKNIKLIYNSKKYNAVITKNILGKTIIRWYKDLADKLEEIFRSNDLNKKIVFVKESTDTYRIEVIISDN